MASLVRARRLFRGRRLVVLAPLFGLGMILAGCYYVVPAPPPYAAPAPGPPPAGLVYVPGQWVWNGAAWVWRPPYWAAVPGGAPPPGAPQPGQPPPPPAGSPPQAPKP